MLIEKEKNSRTKRYNITFTSYEEMKQEINSLVDFITYHKFTIFIDLEYDYQCVATDFCDTILVDRRYGEPVANALESRKIPYRFFS